MEKTMSITFGAIIIILLLLAAEIVMVHQRLSTIEEVVGNQSREISSVSEKLTKVNDKVSSLEESMDKQQQEISSISQNAELLFRRMNETQIKLAQITEQLNELSGNVSKLTGYPRVIVDFTGENIVIDNKPHRIISLAPSITEILFALKLEDYIIGVDDFSNYPPELNSLIDEGKIQRVGGFTTPNYEKIISLNPDIVLTVSGVQEPIAHKLRSLGVKVVVLGSSNINDIVSSIILIGKITDTDTEALILAKTLMNNLQALASMSSTLEETPTVAVIVWNNPIFVVGGSSYIDDLIEFSGGVNVFTNYSESYPMIGPEDLVSNNPDIIIFTEGSGVANYTDALSWLNSLPGGNALNAVSTGQIYVLHGQLSDVFVRPGIRSPVAGFLLLSIIHPEIIGTSPPHDVYESNWNIYDIISSLEEVYNVTINLPFT